jgi:hypothetical protein
MIDLENQLAQIEIEISQKPLTMARAAEILQIVEEAVNSARLSIARAAEILRIDFYEFKTYLDQKRGFDYAMQGATNGIQRPITEADPLQKRL